GQRFCSRAAYVLTNGLVSDRPEGPQAAAARMVTKQSARCGRIRELAASQAAGGCDANLHVHGRLNFVDGCIYRVATVTHVGKVDESERRESEADRRTTVPWLSRPAHPNQTVEGL